MADSEEKIMGRVKFFSLKKERDKGGFGFIEVPDREDIHYNGVDYPKGVVPAADDILELIPVGKPPNETAKDIRILWKSKATSTHEDLSPVANGESLKDEQVDFFLEGHRGELIVSLSYRVNGKPQSEEFQMFLGNFQNPLVYPETDAKFPEDFLVKTDNRGVAVETKNIEPFYEAFGDQITHVTIVAPLGTRMTQRIPVKKKEPAKLVNDKKPVNDKPIARMKISPEGGSVVRAPQLNSAEIRTFNEAGSLGSEKIRFVFDDGVATLRNQLTRQILQEGVVKAENISAFDFTTPNEGIVNIGISYPGRSRLMRVVHLETGETIVHMLQKK